MPTTDSTTIMLTGHREIHPGGTTSEARCLAHTSAEYSHGRNGCERRERRSNLEVIGVDDRDAGEGMAGYDGSEVVGPSPPVGDREPLGVGRERQEETFRDRLLRVDRVEGCHCDQPERQAIRDSQCTRPEMQGRSPAAY